MDWGERCRTCFTCIETKTHNLKEEPKLVKNLELLSGIQVTFDDEYSTNMCPMCVENINKFIEFRDMILRNDEKMKKRVRENLSINQNVEIDFVSCDSYDFREESDYSSNNVKVKLEFPENVISIENPKQDLESLVKRGKDGKSSLPELPKPSTKNKARVKSIRKYVCNSCGEEFSQSLDLSKHKKRLHMRGICNVCGVSTRLDNMRKHMEKHDGKPVKCKICDKVLKNNVSLRSHLLLHRGITFECENCHKVYKTKSEYHRHLKYHKDPNMRRATCELCGKNVRDLSRHRLTHTGERPYKCDLCEKGFTSSHALKVHKRLHTLEKPYVCEYCNMGFPQKVSLITHLKSKHFMNDAEEAAVNVIAITTENTSISSHQIEAELGVPRRRVWNILKKHKFRPDVIRK